MDFILERKGPSTVLEPATDDAKEFLAALSQKLYHAPWDGRTVTVSEDHLKEVIFYIKKQGMEYCFRG